MSEQTDRANSNTPPVDRLSKIWRRISEHKIVQWSVAYVAVAYGLQHGVILASESLEWPSAVARISILLLALGLPLVVTFAWYHGARASRNFSQAELSILAALLVVGSLVFYVFVRPERQVRSPVAQEASVTAARQAAASLKGAISVVVLPFSNMSGDASQEFFTDGMTEEITAALAKVPDLRVVARTSAFEFKGKNIEVDKIGQQLHATHLIEGSVRKASNRVRITAQLIKADDGTHIWAENYDRDLTDVFAIQEDIARAITSSLHMTLGLKPGEQLVNQRQRDPALHDQYLRARNLVRARGASVDQAITLLNDVVARDFNYAPGWAALALAYQAKRIQAEALVLTDLDNAKTFVRDMNARIEAAANQAIKLDPNQAEAWCALSVTRAGRGDHVSAVDLQRRGLAIDPDSPECLQNPELGTLGFVQELLPRRDHLLALEPFVPAFRDVTGRVLFAAGKNDAAAEVLKSALRPGGGADLVLAQVYAAEGRYRDATDVLDGWKTGNPVVARVAATAARLLRALPAPALPNERPELGALDWVYLYAGDPGRFMKTYEDHVQMQYAGGGLVSPMEWAPPYHGVRQTERFKIWVRDAGILTYWRARGWPPQCHPTTGDDFECN